TGKLAHERVFAWRAHRIRRDGLLQGRAYRLGPQPSLVVKARIVKSGKQKVICQIGLADDCIAQAVFGNMGYASCPDLSRIQLPSRWGKPVFQSAGLRRNHAGNGMDEFGLTIAVYTAKRQNLARVQLEAGVINRDSTV